MGDVDSFGGMNGVNGGVGTTIALDQGEWFSLFLPLGICLIIWLSPARIGTLLLLLHLPHLIPPGRGREGGRRRVGCLVIPVRGMMEEPIHQVLRKWIGGVGGKVMMGTDQGHQA